MYCLPWSFFFLFLLQEYPLDDLCNEVIDRWKNSRAEVLQQREQVKGSMLYVTPRENTVVRCVGR